MKFRNREINIYIKKLKLKFIDFARNRKSKKTKIPNPKLISYLYHINKNFKINN